MLETYRFDGPETAPTCLIAHGLFGSARNWNVIAKRLSATRNVISVDMRNHGASPHLPDHSYADLAQDLAEVINTLGAPVDVLGHSMGGKAGMMLALNYPESVNRLVVGDIAPVSYTHSQQPMIDAMRAVDLSTVERRSDAAAQLGNLGVEPALQSFFTQSLDIKDRRWLYNLEALANNMQAIMSFPDTTRTFAGSVLMLSGAESDYVRPEHRALIKSLFPSARFAKIPGAGHWLHADKPREFLATLEAFLA